MPKFQAPPIRTPFIGNPPKLKVGSEMRSAGQFDDNPTNVPSYAWMNYFQNVTNALSTVSAPATSVSAGTPGQFTYDANFFYVCVAKNSWKRIALAAF